ncbi:MAG: hypothetical protein ACR2G2_15080 [Pseudonocardia sp.]
MAARGRAGAERDHRGGSGRLDRVRRLKQNAAPTYKGGVGFCPNLATCDNTDDMLAIDPRPGNTTSNCAADNIALLDLAVSRLPGRYRCRMLVRLDGAGFSHELLEYIAAGGGVRGRDWEFSVGWSCTDTEMDAIAALPTAAWTPGIDQNGDPVEDTFVADLTGLLDLRRWQKKIPELRIIVRDEPLHPRYRKRATEREKQLGRRYQLIAVNTKVGQLSWLDARHRSHVHVENDVKQAKDLGLNRWPSRQWAINVARTQIGLRSPRCRREPRPWRPQRVRLVRGRGLSARAPACAGKLEGVC